MEVVAVELFLIFVVPIEEFPVRGLALAEDAAGGDGGGSGPGVDGFEREILEHYSDFIGIEFRDILAQDGGFGFAGGTFEVAEFDDGYGGVGGAESGLAR